MTPRTLISALLITFALAISAAPARAVEPDEMLADPAQEARARDLSAGLRCLVCRNQSVDDSNAELARDLRLLLRERISAGDTDDQAMAYLVDRYGPYILLKPPVRGETLLLWFGPALILAAAVVGFGLLWRPRSAQATEDPDLSAEDREILAGYLNEETGK